MKEKIEAILDEIYDCTMFPCELFITEAHQPVFVFSQVYVRTGLFLWVSSLAYLYLFGTQEGFVVVVDSF
jgi:hypothetical protein